MTSANIKRLKFACYTSSFSMSVIGNISPILFLTFRSIYGISYSLLGLLVLINFVTQLCVDLIFSFFPHKFNIPLVIKSMPIITIVGLLTYSLWPFFFPDAVYVGLVIGTIIFSAASGLGEVFCSPIVSALPAKDPDREMSKLHSTYAWGVVFVIIFSTLFLMAFGNASWQFLGILFCVIPLISAVLYFPAEIPPIENDSRSEPSAKLFKNKQFWASVIAIFFGGAAECTMAQWSSGYLEQALGIPKIWGDIFGVAMFSATLGLGRTLYSRIGKNIERVLLFGTAGAAVCYLLAALSPFPVIGLVACAFTGFTVSMLWPGNLIHVSDKIPNGGVVMFAMMAAGGDLGASVGPQLIGIITDAVSANPSTINLATSLSLAPDQLGMKIGMLIGMLFPLLGIPFYLNFIKNKRNDKKSK